MYCKNCGKEIENTTKFCPDCGAPVSNNSGSGGKYASKKQKKKKPFYKRWWFWVIIVLIVLIVIGSSGEPAEEATPNAKPSEVVASAGANETTVSATTTIAEATETTMADATQDIDMDTIVSLIEVTLKENFENFNVSYDEDVITINVWQDGIATGAVWAQSGNQECIDSWNNLTESIKSLCLSISDFVDTLGATDTSVVVNVLNDLDTEKVILSVIEGVVLYDAVNE